MPADGRQGPVFSSARFTARAENARLLVERTLELLASQATPHILDLGCGTGDAAISAAKQRRDLKVLALDISPANIAQAKTLIAAQGLDDRIEPICADYLAYPKVRFDAIMCDSTLHLIHGADHLLAGRLAEDLVAGGVLIATVPVESAMNTTRIALRRLWRMMPVGIDALVLSVAQLVYSGVSREALADRIPYLRLVPERLYGARLRDLFAHYGLDVVDDRPCDSPSIFKPDHHLIVWRRSVR
jgi:SAM-dependent methyltransferase